MELIRFGQAGGQEIGQESGFVSARVNCDMSPHGDSRQLLSDYRRGDSRAADELYERYVDRLVAFAHGRINPRLRARVEAEDIVQSAYRSFFVHARRGEYVLHESGDLWRLLAGITVNKLLGELERQGAAKRTIDREAQRAVEGHQLTSASPLPDEVAAVVEDLHVALGELSSDERAVLAHWLQSEQSSELSSVAKSPRTLRRLMARVRQQIERHVLNPSAAETPDAAPPHLPISLSYADYQLERLIGAGGMGKVYRAYERPTGATVALKSLHKSHAFEPHVIRQFLQEGEILARLRHPNIVSLRGLGTFPSGAHFLVMDYIEGTDLETYLRGQGTFSIPEAVAIIRQVADAVAFAHSQGIVHCDLKPGNVLVTPDNHVFVSDFGFACVVAEARRDAPFRWGGTIGYLAPECFEPGSTPTPATDVYSLGVLLRVLLTGRQPGAGDELHNVPGLESLRETVTRCLSPDPVRRFGDVASFAASLPPA